MNKRCKNSLCATSGKFMCAIAVVSLIMPLVLLMNENGVSVVTATTNPLYAGSYSTGGFHSGGEATGERDNVSAWLWSYQAPGWLKLSGFTSSNKFARTSTVTIKFHWQMSRSAPYDMYKISAHYENDKSVSDYGTLSYTSWVWSSLSLSGDEITNLKYLYVYFRYLSTSVEDPPFPKLYVDCVKVEYQEITPEWDDSTTDFSRHQWERQNTPGESENVAGKAEAYFLSTSEKLWTKAQAWSDGTQLRRVGFIADDAAFENSSEQDMIFDVRGRGAGTYYLYLDVTFSYDIVGYKWGENEDKLLCKNEISFSAYATDGGANPIPILNVGGSVWELRPPDGTWGTAIEELMLQGSAGELEGTKHFIHLGEASFDGDERVVFTCDSYAWAEVISGVGDPGWNSYVEIEYYSISISWYVFTW